MRKIKNSPLFTTFLIMAVALCFSIVFAKEQKAKQVNGAEHRNAVSALVQDLLNVADKEGNGIGEQVRTVAKEQNETKDEVAAKIDKIQNRSKIKTFLVGMDYKNTGQLRSEMVKTRNQIERLTRLMNKTTNERNKTIIQEQTQKLEQQQKNIDDFLTTNESKFSLFGWAVKFFNK